MLCFLLFEILSLPLPHLIYERIYEEVKTGIYYEGFVCMYVYVYVYVCLQKRKMKP